MLLSRARYPGAEPHEVLRQPGVFGGQTRADQLSVRVGEPEAERRAPIMVARQFVVEAKTLGARTGKSRGNSSASFREFLPQHGLSMRAEIGFAKR